MELSKAIELIKPAAYRLSGTSSWADLGCGTGLFTKALAQLLQEGSSVYAIDKNRSALNKLKPFGGVSLYKIEADFTHDVLPLSGLNGILMANALHFVADKTAFIRQAQQWLKHEGCFLLIEYDTNTANPWVPFPINFSLASWVFEQSGYATIKKIGVQPSLFNRADIYAALIER